jgi:hypothetical protein
VAAIIAHRQPPHRPRTASGERTGIARLTTFARSVINGEARKPEAIADECPY